MKRILLTTLTAFYFISYISAQDEVFEPNPVAVWIIAVIFGVILLILILAIIAFPFWVVIFYIKKGIKNKKNRKAYSEFLLKREEEKRKIDLKNSERFKKMEELTIQKDKILEVSLAGLYYRTKKAHEIARSLYVGSSLELKRNPSNEYSETAVKVIASGTHIGFIPDIYSEEISTALKKREQYRVFVSKIDNSNIPYIDLILFPHEKNNFVPYDFE